MILGMKLAWKHFHSKNMLQRRILNTLKFFSFQQLPLTLYELHYFLIAPLEQLYPYLNEEWELIKIPPRATAPISIDTLTSVLEELLEAGLVEEELGYYALAGKKDIIQKRWRGYYYGAVRENLIRKFCARLFLLPFVRGVALAGSQALGPQRQDSDIDLLIITDPKFMWTARTIITGYFHFFGVRRYGKKIANRFCLNHYLATVDSLDQGRNLYTAMEYAKLRPLLGDGIVEEFQMNNANWIKAFFPHSLPLVSQQKKNRHRSLLENAMVNMGTGRLEKMLKNILRRRINLDTFVVVRDEELSFHPDSKQGALLNKFFNSLHKDETPKELARENGEVGKSN